MFTSLNNKILWYDGDISLNEEQLCQRMLSGLSVDNCFIDELSTNIKKYNLIANKPLDVKYCNNIISPIWDIPKEYLSIDIQEFAIKKLMDMNKPKDYNDRAMERIEYECRLISDAKMDNLFRAILYLIDHFNKHNIVWGVGRGSSCASFVLYVIGLHCVDCILYDIDAKEFFR